MKDDSIRTYQTRPRLHSQANEILHACAKLFSHIEHRLFAEISSGKDPSPLKSLFLKKYSITARQFNACRVNVEGKISSIKERRKQLILEKKDRIKSLERKISKIKKNPTLVHQKKRRLHLLQKQLKKLIDEDKANTISLCFGSRKLFRAQFNLEANNYRSHEEWLAHWQQTRASEIFFLGSKDETSGNQTCSAKIQTDGNLTLRIRLPDCLISKYGKYLEIPNVRFSYGHQHILASLKNRQALTYRLKHDEKGWQIFVSTTLPKPQWKTNPSLGVIGVDINLDHLALVETDRFGNPILKKTIPLNLYGKTKEQSLALIGDASAKIIQYAKQISKPIILEDLDFQKKKQFLRETSSPSEARKLSSFSYQAIITHLKSRGWGQQVEVCQVNPAFTSLMGRVKFSQRYGLSIHHAAALCIGRRFLGLSEKVPRHLGKISDGKDGYVALSLPVRNRDQHVWTFWRSMSKKLKVALAAHFRAQRSSSTFKTALVIGKLPDLIGEIPIHEPSTELLS